jgi:hypothetical protein
MNIPPPNQQRVTPEQQTNPRSAAPARAGSRPRVLASPPGSPTRAESTNSDFARLVESQRSSLLRPVEALAQLEPNTREYNKKLKQINTLFTEKTLEILRYHNKAVEDFKSTKVFFAGVLHSLNKRALATPPGDASESQLLELVAETHITYAKCCAEKSAEILKCCEMIKAWNELQNDVKSALI